jgi:hypothetical protein
MQSIAEIEQIVQHYHELGETLLAIEFLADQYEIKHPNLKGYEYGEKATLQQFLMTTVGHLGASQIIKIPENTFEYPVTTSGQSIGARNGSCWSKRRRKYHFGQKRTRMASLLRNVVSQAISLSSRCAKLSA